MENWERSQHISRIVSGQMRFRIKDQIFYVRTPTKTQRCLADEIFLEQLEEAECAGAYTQDELQDFLVEKGIWSSDDDDKLKLINQSIEKLKISLYETRFRAHERATIRLALGKGKVEFEKLEILKHSYDHMSALGIASATKQRYLLGCSVFIGDVPYWKDESGWDAPDPFLDKIMFKINQSKISEQDYREISRTEPWRTMWNIQKYCAKGLFEGSVLDLTDEQKNLIIWTSVYESVREHPDNLDDEIINDDDSLDGWMILKKKDREKNHLKSVTDSLTNNPRIKNATERFVPVNNASDAQKVIGLNDEEGMHNLQQRMSTIQKQGSVKEQDLPDTVVRLRQEKMKKFSEQIKGMKGK